MSSCGTPFLKVVLGRLVNLDVYLSDALMLMNFANEWLSCKDPRRLLHILVEDELNQNTFWS